MNKQKIILWIGIVAVLLVILLVTQTLRNQAIKKGYIKNDDGKQTAQPENSEQQDTGANYEYKYISFRDSGEDKNGDSASGKIFRTNFETGKQEIVVPDIYKALPKSDIVNELPYSQIAKSLKSQSVIYLYNPISGKLIRYDGVKNAFDTLMISDSYDVFNSSHDENLSPYIVTSSNRNNLEDYSALFLLDLDKDEITELLKLPPNLTFNPCPWEGCMGPAYLDASWDTSGDVDVKIFDATKPKLGEPGNTGAILKEVRKVRLSGNNN